MITRIKDEGDGGLRVTILSEAGSLMSGLCMTLPRHLPCRPMRSGPGNSPAIATPTEEPEVKKAKGKKK